MVSVATNLCWKLAWYCTFCPNCYMLLLYSCCMCGCCWREALIFSSIIWCVQVSNVKFNILVRQLKLFYIGKQSQPFSFLLRQNKIKRMIPLYVLSFGIWDFFFFIYIWSTICWIYTSILRNSLICTLTDIFYRQFP